MIRKNFNRTPDLADAIAEIRTELRYRDYVFPQRVSAGKMTQAEADFRNAALRLALAECEERKAAQDATERLI